MAKVKYENMRSCWEFGEASECRRGLMCGMGYTEEELLGQNPRVFKSGRHGPAFYEAMWDTMRQTGHWQGEIWNRRKNGEVFPERMSLSAVRGADGAVTHYVCMFTDISEEQAQHQRLEFLAHCDPLTGLPNRAWFGEQLDSAVRQAQDSGEQMALLLLNLDRFKDVNDSYGHAVGDEVLRHTPARWSRACARAICWGGWPATRSPCWPATCAMRTARQPWRGT